MKEYPYDMNNLPPKWEKKYQKAGRKFLKAVMKLDQARMEEMKEEAKGPVKLSSYTPDLDSPWHMVDVFVAPRTGEQYYNGGHGAVASIECYYTLTKRGVVTWEPLPYAVAYDVWVGDSGWPAKYLTTTTKCKITIDSIPLIDQPIPEALQLISPSIPKLGEEDE